MMTPNLYATGHRWVGGLARFDFQLEYQKGWDNMVADALSQITTCLGPKAVKSVLDGVRLGVTHQAESCDPVVIEGDIHLEREMCVAAGQISGELHVTDWAKAQREDPTLCAVLDWLDTGKKTKLKTLLGEHAFNEEGRLVIRNRQNFTVHQNALYLHSTPKGKNEELLLFVVPRVHQTTTLNGCHWDKGHQGHNHTLSLLQECFWWPGMMSQ